MLAMLETETAATEPLYCHGTMPDGRDCLQLLARRYSNGGLIVVVKGETYDERGRVCVVCPNCEKRNRYYPTKRAA